MRIRRNTLIVLAAPLVVLVVAAYAQWAVVGLPALPSNPTAYSSAAGTPEGLPPGLQITHNVTLLLVVPLARGGLQILVDPPRLYWNVHCTPGTEWARFTPIEVPRDRVWTAKDDARPLSPWIGLPGYRHTIGMARHWHFLGVLFWVGNGAVFVALLLATDQWKRLVPVSWHIVPDAWAYFVHYATIHLPPEPNGFYHYNPLQQLSYFGVVFILAPLAILSGPSMSPALTNRFGWYPKLPGNRQVGRSLHFLVMCAFVGFVVCHVAMVAITGFARNMNHIVLGVDDAGMSGVYLGAAGVGVLVGVNALANWLAWRRPRLVQHAARAIVTPVMRLLLDHAAPRAEFRREDISPFLWANGKVPVCEEWKGLAANNFKDYRVRVFGLVENPVDLSLDDLRALGTSTQITLHHCIQGWSGIAAWGGTRMADLIGLVRPSPNAKAVVFHSFGQGEALHAGVEGVGYYDSLSMDNALNAQTLLAHEMNDRPLDHLHGAPLRLRVENQLGFKMVKWIRAIEFVADVRSVGKGEGGFAEDYEYFGELASI